MQYGKLKKIFCCLVFLCLVFKNVSYALQPFNLPSPGFFTHEPHGSGEEDCSIIEIVADYVDMELDGDGKNVFFFCKNDKQRPASNQLRSLQASADIDLAYEHSVIVTKKLKHLEGANRKFTVPAHYNFLFRLTPF